MTDLTARITEILREHELDDVEQTKVGWRLHCVCDRSFDTEDQERADEHSAHVAALIAAAAEEHYRPRVETVEQLDALPIGTVIKIGAGPGGIYERDSGGSWGYDFVPCELEAERAIVVWSPGAGE